MTSNAPAPGTPDTTVGQALAAELLQSATILASTIMATGPKLPTYQGD